MPKIAAFVVAQLVSLALVLGASYALETIPGLERAPDVVGPRVSLLTLLAWVFILLLITPALSRHVSRLFGTEADNMLEAR